MNTCQLDTCVDEMQDYPRFTQDMKNTHTILIPQMAPLHFNMVADIFHQEGYHVEILENGGPEVAQEGLKYVHNDTCYPALLIIGQFIDALKSGNYDLDRTALMITQTGGGCRASNYIHLLRKALVKAGFPQIPVCSLNFSGLERDSGFKLSLTMLRKAFAVVLYGDQLMALSNQVRPYENNPGETDALVAHWQQKINRLTRRKKGLRKRSMNRLFNEIASDFAAIPVTKTPKVKVGVVGEIYVKYSPLGNNHLEDFLASEDCEVNLPGLMGFIQYCIINGSETVKLYGGSRIVQKAFEIAMKFTTSREILMHNAIKKHPNLRPPALLQDVAKLHEGVIGMGAKMGEGWLLTCEMMELAESGFPNIVCAQPFGCLPNHIVGKGMISKIRSIHPEANITPIDYDPSATQVNQENRIKLMIAVANERLENSPAALSVAPTFDALETDEAKHA